MGAVHETTVDLTTVVQHLEWLALELRDSHRQRMPAEISAACDALTCAAVLLRTQQDVPDGHAAHTDLLYDAVAFARSTVETTKMACRERRGSRRGGSEA
ncbi:hypothetical protein [Nocardiopsis rhodophaea]|uniref:hypothetical protein n=1 Tax=Nocardiopsis rhodophaea TaxID=280238 RepID=UPI0031CF6708